MRKLWISLTAAFLLGGNATYAKHCKCDKVKHVPINVNTPMGKAQSMALKGWKLTEQKKYAEAIAAYEEALRGRMKWQKTTQEKEQTALQMQQLASLYQKVGRKEDAIRKLDEATAMMEKAHGPNHPMTQICRQVADVARK
jgi:tetratricopeptide (TPR) repeat protein